MNADDTSCQAYLKALSDDTRWQMVEVLIGSHSPITLGELATSIGISNYNASRHASILEEVGILKTRREGRHKWITVSAELRESIEKGTSKTEILNLGCCSFEFPPSKN